MDCDELLTVLRRYDVQFDQEAVRASLEQDGSSTLADWAKMHLSEDTLLTVDELQQFTALEKSGKADQLAASADLASVQSFSDGELRSAVRELTRSTETIAKQTEELKLRQESLARLLKAQAKDADGRQALELGRAQAWEMDRRDSVSGVDSLARTIELRISELEDQGASRPDAVRRVVGSMFASDDKLLAGLQKLGWELEVEDPEDRADVDRLRDVCAGLIKYTVETVRTKLDCLYLESLEASAESAPPGGKAHGSEVGALQEELESLYSEILPVAQMSVEEQYLGPALKSHASQNEKSLLRSARAMEYIHDCLDYLLDRIDRVSTRIEASQEHSVASHRLVSAARAELSARVEQQPASKRSGRRQTIGSSPTRRRKSSIIGVGTSPSRGGRSRRRSPSAGSALAGEDRPLEQLLAHVGLSLPDDRDGLADEDDGCDSDRGGDGLARERVAVLAAAVAERTGKAGEVGRNVQESFEAAATTQLADARLALQLVRDSLLAESPFGAVRLVDAEVEGSLEFLEGEMENVRKRLAGVEDELVRARGRRGGKREEIVRRWGR